MRVATHYPRRLLGLDVGDRRIGMAISVELGLTAQGLSTLERRNKRADMAAIQEIITTHAVEGIVVGIPRNMDGLILQNYLDYQRAQAYRFS
jgi:putative Holliday junction resolvase